MLERFKASIEGTCELAVILEQISGNKRRRFIRMALSEDRNFTREALRKAVFFEDLMHLDSDVLSEILSEIPPQVIAFALVEQESDLRNHLLKHLGNRLRGRVKEEDQFLSIKDVVSCGSHFSAQKFILKTARRLEKEGKFIFELVDCPRFAKPDNF